MDQQTTYAPLAAGSYLDTRPLVSNRGPLPPGWKLLDEFTRSGSGPNASLNSSGFSARVYQAPANEIVISYGGTEFSLHDNASGTVIDFVSGNVLALGLYGEQAFQAAKLYQEVQQRFGTGDDWIEGGIGDDDIVGMGHADVLFGGMDIRTGAAARLTQWPTSRSGRIPVRRRRTASEQGVAQ